VEANGESSGQLETGFATCENVGMKPTLQDVDRRLKELEKEIASLKGRLPQEPGRHWITEIAGTFKGDPVFGEIIRLGALSRRRKTK